MFDNNFSELHTICDKLINGQRLEKVEFLSLLKDGYKDKEIRNLLSTAAVHKRKKIYGDEVYVRGLIEISNICRNDCFYCGIRKGNFHAVRYRLEPDDIISLCDEGYELGFRTFVLQGGEDAYYTDRILTNILSEVKERHSDCAITLSLGERSSESYRILREAGADRYLLRHETANPRHYSLLHPPEMSYNNRIHCLYDLRESGYQVGCGFMVGSPYQTEEDLASDLCFIQDFLPEMCGIGPFIPHKDTIFKAYPAGELSLVCMLLSIIRLIHPSVLLPATTALGTIHPQGRELGILSGANVIMPNLSPISVRKHYSLYDNKIFLNEESAQNIKLLSKRMEAIGYKVAANRGDYRLD